MKATLTRGGRALLALSVIGLAACSRTDAQAQDDERGRPVVASEPAQQPQPPEAEAIDTLTAARLSSTFRAAASRALPAVVSVTVESMRENASSQGRFRIPFPFDFDNAPDRDDPDLQRGEGSGFIYDPEGLIITNRHVVRNATEVTVQLQDGRVYDAEILGADPDTDVAVLKIEPRDGELLPAAELGDSDVLQVGDWVLALGNPLGLDFTVTAGIVSAKGRSIGIINREAGPTALEAFIQTDAAINRGNSGGPLVDLLGRVIGVNTAIFSPTGFSAGNGFAIPIAIAQRVARDLVEYGVVRRPRIGVSVTPVTEADAEIYGLDRIAGALIAQVQPDSPAEDAGMRLEDVVVSVDGDPIDDAVDLTTTLARYEPGQRVTLGVVRDGRRISVPVTLGQFDAEPRPERRVASRPRAEELLGISVRGVSPQVASRFDIAEDAGVIVTEVDPFGPAPRQLDRSLIVEINGEAVSSPRDVERIAADLEPGDVVSMKYLYPGQDDQPRIVNYRIR